MNAEWIAIQSTHMDELPGLSMRPHTWTYNALGLFHNSDRTAVTRAHVRRKAHGRFTRNESRIARRRPTWRSRGDGERRFSCSRSSEPPEVAPEHKAEAGYQRDPSQEQAQGHPDAFDERHGAVDGHGGQEQSERGAEEPITQTLSGIGHGLPEEWVRFFTLREELLVDYCHNTARAYWGDLQDWFEWAVERGKDVLALTEQDQKQYYAMLRRRGYSEGTVRRRRTALRKILGLYGVRHG